MEKVLETRNLCKKYKNTDILENISITIKKGDIYGLVGRNGAGKTTFMKVIAGLTYKNSGDIEIFENSDFEKERYRLGFSIENPSLYEENTAKENLKIYAKLMGGVSDEDIEELLKEVGLEKNKDQKVNEFSLGMKKILSIAIAMLGKPEFLILDEPINGLDLVAISKIRSLLKKLNEKENVTILISSHIISELTKVATKYGIIDSGRLIKEMTVEELEEEMKNFDTPEDYFLSLMEK